MREAVPTIQLKKEITTLQQPTGNSVSGHLSIKQLLQKEEEFRQKAPSDLLRSTINDDLLIQSWKGYAQKMRLNDKEAVGEIMLKHELVKVADENYSFKVESTFDKGRLEQELIQILTVIREKVSNHYLTVDVVLAERNESTPRLLTADEKFETMSRSNIILKQFKEKFNLSIEP